MAAPIKLGVAQPWTQEELGALDADLVVALEAVFGALAKMEAQKIEDASSQPVEAPEGDSKLQGFR